MALTAGIVGLPNVGKSTLFNAITQSEIEAANYPFATIEPNVGIVELPDKRLDELAKIINPERILKATIEFTDIAGLVEGASKGEGLGNQFLSHIREVEAICHVVRCFDDENIIHVHGGVSPKHDTEIINLELIFADLDTVTKRYQRLEKKAQLKEKDAVKEFEVVVKCKEALENNMPVRTVEFTNEQRKELKKLNLLTAKSMLYVANVPEEDINNPEGNKYYQELKEIAEVEGCGVVHICANFEEQFVGMDVEEKQEMLNEFGIEQSGLDTLIQATFKLLGLATYFTAGVKEVRAWTFTKGMLAPQCAGVIHGDFERGFIKAEVVKYEDFIECGGFKGAMESGKLKLEGKEYEFQDGDVTVFKFNV